MPLLLPDEGTWFPPESIFSPEGLVGVGGLLSVERLLAAYRSGIFPWYDAATPILWWNPPQRCVLWPTSMHIPRSLARSIRLGRYRISLDTAFEQVITACACSPRPGQTGTWITPEMREAYLALHEAGYAHSVEAWDQEGLAGGLYGVSLGGAFFGESMFYWRPDASKTALVWLVSLLASQGFSLVDCQQVTANLLRFGAVEINRADFMSALKVALNKDGWQGKWEMPANFSPLDSVFGQRPQSPCVLEPSDIQMS